ncbi:MAG: SLC13/DASS family transporter [Lachnospiraceae bacterium]|nr:SLC13/DASS family transporter [Lachnospiraceae bacterium]
MQEILRADILGLLILAICLVLFLTKWISATVTAMLGCLMMVLFKVGSFEEIFSGFSSSIVLLMAGAMIVGLAMFNTGTAQLLGRAAVKFSRGGEKGFLLAICILTGLMSMFLANTALIASFIPIIDSVAEASGRMKRRNLVLPMALSAMFGGASILIGTTPQLTANALLLELSGMEMGMWTLTGPGLLIFAVYLIYLYFWGYADGNRIWGNREEILLCGEEGAKEPAEEEIYDKKKISIMLVIIGLMILSYIFGIFSTAVTAMLAAVLCLLTGLLTVEDVVKKLQWETIVFLAGCLGIANGLSGSGAGELVGSGVISLLGGITSPYLIFIVFVVITLGISQFITNSAAIVIVLPIALTMSRQLGFNEMAFTLGITLAASYASLTPLAASQIAMTEVAGYEFSDYFRYGWKLTLLALVGILIFIPLFFPLTV